MDGLWSGPAPEQDVDADAKIDQGDEAEPLIDGAIFRLENDLDVELGGAVEIDRLGDRAGDGVGGVGPDAAAKHLPGEGGDAGGRLVVDTDEDIAGAYAGAMAWGDRWNALSPEAGGCLNPP